MNAWTWTLIQVGSAVKFSSSINKPRFAPPSLGQHTQEFLQDVLQLNSDEMENLINDGVLKWCSEMFRIESE